MTRTATKGKSKPRKPNRKAAKAAGAPGSRWPRPKGQSSASVAMVPVGTVVAVQAQRGGKQYVHQSKAADLHRTDTFGAPVIRGRFTIDHPAFIHG